jgi:hypothetical protein
MITVCVCTLCRLRTIGEIIWFVFKRDETTGESVASSSQEGQEAASLSTQAGQETSTSAAGQPLDERDDEERPLDDEHTEHGEPQAGQRSERDGEEEQQPPPDDTELAGEKWHHPGERIEHEPHGLAANQPLPDGLLQQRPRLVLRRVPRREHDGEEWQQSGTAAGQRSEHGQPGTSTHAGRISEHGEEEWQWQQPGERLEHEPHGLAVNQPLPEGLLQQRPRLVLRRVPRREHGEEWQQSGTSAAGLRSDHGEEQPCTSTHAGRSSEHGEEKWQQQPGERAEQEPNELALHQRLPIGLVQQRSRDPPWQMLRLQPKRRPAPHQPRGSPPAALLRAARAPE